MAYDYVVGNGTIVSDTSEIKTEVETEWKGVSGEDSTVDASSFEGRLIDMFTTERIGVARNNTLVANQLNPNMASDVSLDSHLANIGSKRDGAEQSTVECVLTGVPGTIIPSGLFAQDTSDNKYNWTLVDETTIKIQTEVDHDTANTNNSTLKSFWDLFEKKVEKYSRNIISNGFRR